MAKKYLIYLSIISITASAIYFSHAAENSGYRERFVDFLEKASGSSAGADNKKEGRVFIATEDTDPSGYNKGDWYEYTSDKNKYNYLKDPDSGNIYSGDNINISTYGIASLNLKYGAVRFTDKKYKQYDEDEPVSRVISKGFFPEQVIQLHVEGEAGDRVTVYIDHDSKREENHYLMKYKALSDDELVREVNAGEIDIKFNHSKFAVYDNTDAKGLGIDFTLGRENFLFKAFGSVARGETAVDYFRGNSSQGNTKLAEYQYIRKTYYQLEPFVRYDGVSAMPATAAVIYSSVTVTSAPSNPSAYTLSPVNISTDGFELYMDDQNQYNNYNAIQLSLDNGYYTRLVNGTDYTINYTTGVIKLIRDVPENARIFAVYNRGGGTLDPCSVSPGDSGHPGGTFTGRIFVFIKYGYSINEDLNKNFIYSTTLDKNNDGKLNLDIYEIRSFYFLGSKNLISGNLSLGFWKENSVIPESERESLSSCSVDYSNGIIQFFLREPFRSLLASTASYIYSETKLTNSYTYSRYSIKADYSVEARSFQLTNSNLIEKSVRVKIDGREISSSLYSVDYTSGYLAFTNPNNPVIGSSTQIEVKYEYLPFGRSDGKFIGGMRGDYNVSKDLRIGGSVLLSKDAETDVIPDVGDESESTLVFEGDATLKLTEKRLTEFFRSITGSRRRVPAELSFYAEHARSIKDVNTFGKGLIDNMETSGDTLSISLSEKDWILSSIPASETTAVRGILNYYYYRDPGSPETLLGAGFSPYKIDYSVKPGPYNIATGHIDNSITDLDNQRSLVFDFDFTSGDCFSVVTRNLSDGSVDLSGVQYIELWVKFEGSAGNIIDLFMEFGSVNEDSDNDGFLDTEDANRNGYIDSEPSSGYSEDRGYKFGNNITVVGGGPGLNRSTMGDGVLNTEDLDGNGVLDTNERVYRRKIESADVPVIQAGNGWQKIRVYIDSSSLTSTETDILQQVKNIRLYGERNTGTAGRLYIDSMRLVTSKWKNAELDGASVSDPDVIKLTMVDSINDSDYKNDSFLLKQTGLYESLYGDDSVDDIETKTETSLQMEYAIDSAHTELTVTQRFTREMDLRFYNTLNAWINVRSISASNYISYIIGSSDDDYMEFRTVPASTSTWLGLAFKLNSKSSGDIEQYQVTGSPDMRRIKFIKLKITGTNTSGKIWFNDIYVSEPEDQEGSAKWYEANLKILEPLMKTGSGTPLFSNVDLKYIYKNISSSFNSPNRTEKDISEVYHEFYSSTRILPNWAASADYIREDSVSDSIDENLPIDKRGRVQRNYLLLNSAFSSTGGYVPSVTVSYSMDRTEGEKDLEVSGADYEEKTDKVVHSPVITWTQQFADFLWGKLTASLTMNMLFSEDSSRRGSDAVSDTVLSGYLPLKETEKRQKADASFRLDYVSGGFFVKPVFNMSASEIVAWQGESNSLGINDELKGNYHFPFLPMKDTKYLERNNGVTFITGYSGMEYLSPEYNLSFSYRENAFEDYGSDFTDTGIFSRSKGSISTFNTGIRIPVMLKKIKLFENVRHFQLGYSRGMTLSETDVPYEGEGTDYFDEEYGVSRVLSKLSPEAYNLYRNYPGINFTGRGNYARGRDMLYKSMNEKIELMELNSSIEYDNSLRLDEKFTADFSANIDVADITVSGSLGQICERGNLYGIPNQVVTWQTGINSDFDLMKILSTGFFRANSAGLPYHGATLSTGLDYTDSMLITENIDEKKISPSLGLTFKIDRTSFGVKGSLDYRKRKSEEFIDYECPENDPDYIYVSNMEGSGSFSETDKGYKFSAFYETDVKWIYDYFSLFYKLNGLPVFSAEYTMEIDRYDYTKTVSPEPYDLYMLKSDLTLDLHKNVRGGMTGRMALEKFRNRENNGVSREVFSYEISGTISLIF